MSESYDFVVSDFNGHRQYSVESEFARPSERPRAHPSIPGAKVYGAHSLVELARVSIPPYLHDLRITELADLYERHGKL